MFGAVDDRALPANFEGQRLVKTMRNEVAEGVHDTPLEKAPRDHTSVIHCQSTGEKLKGDELKVNTGIAS